MPAPAPTKPSPPAKKVINASIPGTQNSPIQNISDEEKKRILDGWDKQAADRAAMVARECAPPSEPTRILRFELRQYGRYWQAVVVEGKKQIPLMGAPSLLASALDALEDAMLQRANRA